MAVEPAVRTPHRMKKAYSRVSGLRRAGASTRALPPLEDGAERGQPAAQLAAPGSPADEDEPEEPGGAAGGVPEGVDEHDLALGHLQDVTRSVKRQSWETYADRAEGTQRIEKNDPAIQKVVWSGFYGKDRVDEVEVISLCRALRANEHVQSVELKYSPDAMSDAAVGAMLSALAQSEALVSVHFGAESLSEEQREAVCAACVKNACACLAADDPLLETLDWTALGLEDEHMEEVAAALQSNTHLRTLQLGSNPELTDKGVEPLLLVLEGKAASRAHVKSSARTEVEAFAHSKGFKSLPELQAHIEAGASRQERETLLAKLEEKALKEQQALAEPGASCALTRLGLSCTGVSAGLKTRCATRTIDNALEPVRADDRTCVTLDLGLFCGIVDEHLEMVGQALAQNTAVRSLRLGFNE